MTTGPFDGPFMGDFPDRPDHADFWTLSELILQQDGKAIEDPAFDMHAHIARIVDPESLTYFRQQRVGMALQRAAMLPNRLPDQIVVESIWLDAFMLGVAFAERRGGARG